MVGSSSTSSSGRCSSAAVTSPRMRWPSESCRTGVARNSASRAARRTRRARSRRRRHPVDGAVQVEALAAAAGPTRAGCAARTRRRCAGPASRRSRTGSSPHTRGPARGRHQHAGQHLDRGGLARPVRAEEADRLARRDGQRHALDGRHPLPPRHDERPGQPVGFDVITTPSPGSGAPRCARRARRPRPWPPRRAGSSSAATSGKPERIGPPGERERREVRDERAGHDEAHDPPQPRPVDGDGVGGGEVGAVGHRVGHLAAVDQPERHAVRRDPDRTESSTAPASGATTATTTRSGVQLDVAQRPGQRGQPDRDPARPGAAGRRPRAAGRGCRAGAAASRRTRRCGCSRAAPPPARRRRSASPNAVAASP